MAKPPWKFSTPFANSGYKAEAEHLTEINVYLRMYISALRKEYIESLSAINKKQADDGKN